MPDNSRAAQGKLLNPDTLTESALESVRGLNALAQMPITRVLRGGGITTALIGASRPSQIEDCARAIGNLEFTEAELAEIDRISSEETINLWARSSEGV
ncbi:hypothetical protein Q0601_23685 [Paracoccus onubensis]|uniref:hypothetical protein n=1 Tax=Paracoccus onubensis TaxID=1675788 RepID=UPI00272FFD46|nr:hypothetical protein [Paracoccus onubensis]MDP0930185.1 hypothetical protein [Paracoccus onubensis]